ncbi:MAG: serine/threonine protein kinase [Proteobacteria bacterium]|nr:MAG: serine/threonine protein kinase [Pseudomonadota bacterium]
MRTLRGKQSEWIVDEATKLGSGGNSNVFRAHRLDEPTILFALKLFTETADSNLKRARFKREISIVENLNGVPGCSQLIDSGIEGEHPFYVMELYSGGDLYRRFIKTPPNPLEVEYVLHLFEKVIVILSALHAEPRKLAVRDLKPQNILLRGDGSPVICDFGLALWSDTADSERLTDQKVVGSVGYRPPEWDSAYPPSDQTAGDIWSLGRTLWAVLSGKNPPNNYDSLGANSSLRNFLDDTEKADAIQGLVNQCTRFNPDERPSAKELHASLLNVIDFCGEKSAPRVLSSLDKKLAGLSVRLPGSPIVATAMHKKAELDSKLAEIEACREILMAKLREYQPRLEAVFNESTGNFGVFGRATFKHGSSYQADASIHFFPHQALVETGMGSEIAYKFNFGLNTNQEFVFWESISTYGYSQEGNLIPTRSLSTLGAQKSGQIEKIISERFVVEMEQMLLRNLPSLDQTTGPAPTSSGRADFDYSSNDGKFIIGTGVSAFETTWTKASDTAIHCYRRGNISAIALARGVRDFEHIGDVSRFDFSSNNRSPKVGEIVIWKNINGRYAATRIVEIWDDGRGRPRDRLVFDYFTLSEG